MRNIIILLLLCSASLSLQAQEQYTIIIKNKETGELLPGATLAIPAAKQSFTSDKNGTITLKKLPSGKYQITCSHTGYETFVDSIIISLQEKIAVAINLVPVAEEIEEVIVQSTRTSRTIKNTPTRVEIIDAEEVEEKSNMRPANVAMLLHESTGLQVQQTSATSGNASIRMQGLDGRYTQLLKDGYPNFGNFASGLSILEIPPLDLAQVEVIKGPASTLYGGGAIAGVINFISKKPKEKPALNAILNQSSVWQTNFGVYASQKYRKIGYSILGLVNFQKAYDADKDGFSELPKARSFTIHPTLYFYLSDKTELSIGNSYANGKNEGGDMQVIKEGVNNEHNYTEKNITQRNTSTLEINHKINSRASLRLKQSLSIFDRDISIPNYTFVGVNTNVYTELSATLQQKKHLFNVGANIIADRFRQHGATTVFNQDARSFTSGVYLQDTWDASNFIIVEMGARLDNVKYTNTIYSDEELFLLPRLSVLFKINDKLSSRLTGGMGYKAPTIFTEQTETIQYKNVAPISDCRSEKSSGVTADINYKTGNSNQLSFSINQLFFYTSIRKPLLLNQAPSQNWYFSNAKKPVNSTGFETNLKFIYKNEVKLFVGYTYTLAKSKYLTGNQYLTLLPKHKLNLALLYEREDRFKLGLEGYLTGSQYLSDGSATPSFWELGFMAEKIFHHFSLFVNFENFTDERQSKYKRVVNGPATNPVFDEIWNHTEGFIVNGGIKFRL